MYLFCPFNLCYNNTDINCIEYKVWIFFHKRVLQGVLAIEKGLY